MSMAGSLAIAQAPDNLFGDCPREKGATDVIRGYESFDRGGEGRGIYPAGPFDGSEA